MNGRTDNPVRRRVSPRRGGQVLAIVVLCIPVLVGFVFYAYNTGDQINKRMGLQNAADSTAASGGVWMARSMNVVAMNNVAEVRLVALLLTMDSMPLAAEMAVVEESNKDRLTEALEKWKTVGAAFTPYERENFFRQGLAELYRQMSAGAVGTPGGQHYDQDQLELLKIIDRAFDAPEERTKEGGYQVKDSTQWEGGAIWQAVLSLDEFSQVTAETAGFFAQQNAVAYGKANHAETAFLVPLQPKFPGYRATWDQYGPVFLDHEVIRNDVKTLGAQASAVVQHSNLVENLKASDDIPRDSRLFGVRGGAIPDFAEWYRMGPFGREYGWRDYASVDNNKPWWDPARQIWTSGYTTYGPMENALRLVVSQFGGRWQMGSTDTSRFEFHLRTIAKVKLAYLFGLAAPQKIQYAEKWITDYAEAKAYAEKHAGESPDTVMVTRYYQVGVVSTVPWDDGANWMKTYEARQPEDTKQGTEPFTPKRWHSWQLNSPPPEGVWQGLGNPKNQPLFRWAHDHLQGRGRPGWDPTNETPGGWEKLTDYVWIQKRESSVKENALLNLPPRYWLKADGTHVLKDADAPDNESNWVNIPYKIYTVTWRVFGGIEIRDEVEVTNPGAGSTIASLPAPILLDTSEESFLRVSLPGDSRIFPLQTVNAEGAPSVAHVNGVQVKPFMYLGVARRPLKAVVWPRGFKPAHPSGDMLANAQVKVFNNRSWDLWTQDWHCQLTPVSDWSGWISRMNSADVANVPGLSAEDVQRCQKYMNAVPAGLVTDQSRH
ncbi:MAG: pilus assembly protein TadG-related protein [Planctomycetota bacterium]|nr:pilus assembly protein TadG-related protein [Planctomycetota bacterium]